MAILDTLPPQEMKLVIGINSVIVGAEVPAQLLLEYIILFVPTASREGIKILLASVSTSSAGGDACGPNGPGWLDLVAAKARGCSCTSCARRSGHAGVLRRLVAVAEPMGLWKRHLGVLSARNWHAGSAWAQWAIRACLHACMRA